MPLKRADDVHGPRHTHWKDHDGILYTMVDAEDLVVRCFVERFVLDNLRGEIGGNMMAVFQAHRDRLEKAASRFYEQNRKPIEIVLTKENYPELDSVLE